MGFTFGNVSYQNTGIGNVDSWILLMDRHFPYRATYPVVTGKYPTGRNLYSFCNHVRAVYPHYMETCTGNDRKIFGRNRKTLGKIKKVLTVKYVII